MSFWRFPRLPAQARQDTAVGQVKLRGSRSDRIASLACINIGEDAYRFAPCFHCHAPSSNSTHLSILRFKVLAARNLRTLLACQVRPRPRRISTTTTRSSLSRVPGARRPRVETKLGSMFDGQGHQGKGTHIPSCMILMYPKGFQLAVSKSTALWPMVYILNSKPYSSWAG